MDQLPSLNALKMFTVVGQTLNFSKAAQELNVTQGAVSRQILRLEESLGFKLFIRQQRHLELTDKASELLPEITRAFELLEHSIGQLQAKP